MLRRLLLALLCTVANFTALASSPEREVIEPRGRENIPLQLTSPLSLAEAERVIAIHHPSYFTGLQEYRPEITAALREKARTLSSSDHLYIEHIEQLLPLVHSLQDYIDASESDPYFCNKLKSEISQYISEKNIYYAWVLADFFRHAASFKATSPEEYDLFSHTTGLFLLKGLANNNAWLDPVKTFASISMADEGEDKPKRINTFFNINPNLKVFTEKQIIRTYPTKIYYPFGKMGKFGIAFLLSCYLKNVYPLAFPTENFTAHGTSASPLGFALHDLVHAIIDPRSSALKEHILGEADAYFLRGGDAKRFIRTYAPHAAIQFLGIMHALQNIYFEFLTKLLPYHGQADFSRTMVGFFFMLHEYPIYESDIYKSHDLEEVITKLAQGTINVLQEEEAIWESPWDPLQTSPIDGKSALSKKEIKNYVFKNFLLSDSKLPLPPSYYAQAPYPETKAFRTKYIHHSLSKAKVSSSQRFIDVSFELRTGEKLKYSFPTLFHKWQNMDDNLSLLKMAGVSIDKPPLTAGTQERKVAQDTLETVRSELVKLIEHFCQRALYFVNRKGPDDLSLADKYFTWHYNSEKQIQELLEKKLPPAPAKADAS